MHFDISKSLVQARVFLVIEQGDLSPPVNVLRILSRDACEFLSSSQRFFDGWPATLAASPFDGKINVYARPDAAPNGSRGRPGQNNSHRPVDVFGQALKECVYFTRCHVALVRAAPDPRFAEASFGSLREGMKRRAATMLE